MWNIIKAAARHNDNRGATSIAEQPILETWIKVFRAVFDIAFVVNFEPAMNLVGGKAVVTNTDGPNLPIRVIKGRTLKRRCAPDDCDILRHVVSR